MIKFLLIIVFLLLSYCEGGRFIDSVKGLLSKKSPTRANSIIPKVSIPDDVETLKRKSIEIILSTTEKALHCFTYILFFRFALKIVKAGLQEFAESAEKIISNKESLKSSKLQNLLPENATLNVYEMDIMSSSLILPSDITEDWDRDIGGLDQIKSTLESMFHRETLQNRTYYQNHTATNSYRKDFKSIRSALFYGPPGCGKSTLMHAFCKHHNLPLIKVNPSTVMRKYHGESNALLRAIFTLGTKLAPAVMIIDEMDALLRTRDGISHEIELQIKAEFMQLWDNAVKSKTELIILGATNRPQDLDAAIQRRFDQSFFIGPPDFPARIQILKTLLPTASDADPADSDTWLAEKTFDFVLIGRQTEGYTGSDLAALCKFIIHYVTARQRRESPNDSLVRTIRTSDALEAMQQFCPTSWSAKSYGSPYSTLNMKNMNTDVNMNVNTNTQKTETPTDESRHQDDNLFEDEDDDDEEDSW